MYLVIQISPLFFAAAAFYFLHELIELGTLMSVFHPVVLSVIESKRNMVLALIHDQGQ